MELQGRVTKFVATIDPKEVDGDPVVTITLVMAGMTSGEIGGLARLLNRALVVRLTTLQPGMFDEVNVETGALATVGREAR